MILLVVVGLAVTLFEAMALTPIHHRVVEAMNHEPPQEASNGTSAQATTPSDTHVLTDYAIEAGDAAFFWQAIAAGLLVLVIVKACFVCYHLRKHRRRTPAVPEKLDVDRRKKIFDKRQSLYHIVSQHLEYIVTDQLQVSKIMSSDVKCVEAGATIETVRKQMEINDLHHLVVVDGSHRPLGAIYVDDLHKQGDIAQQIMNSQTAMIDQDANLIPAITHMLERRTDCLLVVSDGKLAGVITKTDVGILLQCVLRVFSHADIGPRIAQVVGQHRLAVLGGTT